MPWNQCLPSCCEEESSLADLCREFGASDSAATTLNGLLRTCQRLGISGRCFCLCSVTASTLFRPKDRRKPGISRGLKAIRRGLTKIHSCRKLRCCSRLQCCRVILRRAKCSLCRARCSRSRAGCSTRSAKMLLVHSCGKVTGRAKCSICSGGRGIDDRVSI